MDNKDTPERRRPLPIPNVDLHTPQRPNTPVHGSATPVPPISFYSNPQGPPPLPSRPRNAGSGHTVYVRPPTPPPTYRSSDPSPFREPELVTEHIAEEDSVPDLVPNDINMTSTDSWQSSGEATWNNSQYDWNTTEASPWPANPSSWHTGVSGYDSMDLISADSTTKRVTIDGRDEEEELLWWDSVSREKHRRPGPGMLPPVLEDEFHNSGHSLFSVSVTPPDLRLPEPSPKVSSSAIPSEPSPPVPARSHSAASHSSPPRPDEFRQAVPHPNAYYCPADNGWVVLVWKSSSVLPPMARSFQESSHNPLPNQNRRKRTTSCVADDDHPFGRSNKTHHFHRYEKAVDALKLTHPLRRSEWEIVEKVKQRRRAGTIMGDIDIERLKDDNTLYIEEDQPEEEEGDLLDLYMCCQCSFYCVASGIIPGVIPRKFFHEFVKEKYNNPMVGKTAEQSVLTAWDMIITIIENKLFKGENRNVRVNRSAFRNKIGWSVIVRRVTEALGFAIDTQVVEGKEEEILRAPTTDVLSPQGKLNRAKLMRAWVEINAWIVDYRRIYGAKLKDPKPFSSCIKIENAREIYQRNFGAHPDQIQRGNLGNLMLLQPLQKSWRSLGLTGTSYSAELLAFAYLAQCRCDPSNTIEYFTHFYNIIKCIEEVASPQEREGLSDLHMILTEERSRSRFTHEDLDRAVQTLGFGLEGPLKVEFDNDVPEQFIMDAWKDRVKRAWRMTEQGFGISLHQEANEAFMMIAQARGSSTLMRLWEDAKNRTMHPDRAYETLEVPKEVEDESLILVYNMRLQEQPLQHEKWAQALSVIAEIRDSERLRQFLSTGKDPGDIVAPTPPDLPRGLNQLGNTCYLNSLLQYFYTIKELREAVAPMGSMDLKSLEDDKLTDDDLKRHRVGGRLVTRREIIRSKKFISQLADLFWNLEYCESAAITPTVELAKLALVTSRDEEEDEADKGGTESSNDTDATLVDDGPSRFTVSEQALARSPSSVLGKRPRDLDRNRSAMDVDESDLGSPREKGDLVTIASSRQSFSPDSAGESSSSKVPQASTSVAAITSSITDTSNNKADKDGDVEMHDVVVPAAQNAPPLPPRKAPISDSVMMFGKQHDVAECMDNCMFQIETALLKFDAMSGSQDAGKTSVVKKLFYGKIRQRLAVMSDDGRPRSSIHEKEDLFSHLPVNVTDDGVDIYDGLSGYFDDVVEFEGKKAKMEVSLTELPPLLQIQLQRVQFNRETLQPYKSQAYVKFGETVYMDRFMDTGDPEKKARSKTIQAELNSCRERVRLLVTGKGEPFTASLRNTHDFLSKQDIITLPEADEDLVLQLKKEEELLNTEIDTLRERADHLKDELEGIWRDDSKVAYELTSVFIHRGSSPSWGHYFFYSRHLPDQPDSWFKYNDSDVTTVSKEEVLADTTGSTANPYLLVFARKGLEVVDTVKRFDPATLEETQTT